jgi:hypothetical protein
MPPMDTYYVGKGTQFGVMDALFDGSDPKIYRDTITKLESSTTLLQLAKDRQAAGGNLSPTDVNHFEKDWLGAWWTGKQVEKVLKAGILKAVQVALLEDPANPESERTPPLPIETLWVCNEEGVFHVYVNKGPNQVTVIVYTPPPGKYVVNPDLLREDIWVVKIRDKWDEEYDGKYPDGSIRVLNEEGDTVLIERQLSYVRQAGA